MQINTKVDQGIYIERMNASMAKHNKYLNKVIKDPAFDFVLSNYSAEDLVDLDTTDDWMVFSVDVYGPTYLISYMDRSYEFQRLMDAVNFIKKCGYEV